MNKIEAKVLKFMRGLLRGCNDRKVLKGKRLSENLPHRSAVIDYRHFHLSQYSSGSGLAFSDAGLYGFDYHSEAEPQETAKQPGCQKRINLMLKALQSVVQNFGPSCVTFYAKTCSTVEKVDDALLL